MSNISVDPGSYIRAQDARSASDVEFRHFPVLDGLRGMAVLIVMFYHLDQLIPQLKVISTGGFLGVDIFFVLSGFLITSILLKEQSRESKIDLKNFYVRRFARLTPALWLFLLFLYFQADNLLPPLQAVILFSDNNFLYAVTYLINWHSAAGGITGHLNHIWSLAIEEQFYIVWSLILFKAFGEGWTRKQIMTGTGCMILLLVTQRAVRAMYGADPNSLYYSTDTRIDGLLIGCFASMIYCWKVLPADFYASAMFRRIFLLAALVGSGIFMTFSYNDPRLYYGFISIFSLSVAVSIVWLISNNGTILHTILESALLRWIGRISYGLYLWHYFFYAVAKEQTDHIPGQVAIGIGLSFLAASFSFYLVENPILSLKAVLQRKAPSLSEAV